MFGNNDQNNQQQDNNSFGQPMNDAMSMADGSLSNDSPANNGSNQNGQDNGFGQGMSAPTVAQANNQSPFDNSPDSAPHDELLNIKQGALQQLSPLVGHLDQTPEEKFRTTMMMIQASDDQSLIKTAYEAAQKISDDKARAQALLDVINEINYFTQHSK